MKTSLAVTVSAILMGATVSACGGDDPAVCSSVDDLKSSIQDLQSIDVTSGDSLSDVQSGLEAVKSDFDTVKADAKSEFSSGISAVETSYATLTMAVDDAVSTQTAATLSTAASALSAFGSDVDALVSDVDSTC